MGRRKNGKGIRIEGEESKGTGFNMKKHNGKGHDRKGQMNRGKFGLYSIELIEPQTFLGYS